MVEKSSLHQQFLRCQVSYYLAYCFTKNFEETLSLVQSFMRDAAHPRCELKKFDRELDAYKTDNRPY